MKIKKTMLLFVAILTIPCVSLAGTRPVVVYMYDKYFYKCGRHSLFSFGMTGDVIVK